MACDFVVFHDFLLDFRTVPTVWYSFACFSFYLKGKMNGKKCFTGNLYSRKEKRSFFNILVLNATFLLFYLLFFASNLPIKPLEQVKIAWLMLEIDCPAHQHEQKICSLSRRGVIRMREAQVHPLIMAIPRFIQLRLPSPPLKPMAQSRRGATQILEDQALCLQYLNDPTP
jgi:hypothetical protein